MKIDTISKLPNEFIQYQPISEFPSSKRDLSFSLTNQSILNELNESILSFKKGDLKDIFIFDYYHDKNKDVIKIGYRFLFQSTEYSMIDADIDVIISDIIRSTTELDGVSIPGVQT